MNGGGNARGGLGWAILAVALAVPGVLFYNWWSHLKAEREKTVAAKARGRVQNGAVFQSSPNARLINPISESASALPVAAPDAPVASTVPAVASEAIAGAPLPEPIVNPAASVFAASEPPAAPPLPRDPTLSPSDRLREREAEAAKLRAARDLDEMSRTKLAGKSKKPALPTKGMEVQGIIINPESGNKAIVNNEVVGIGSYVGKSKVKVVKISDSGVTFEFDGRRFSKGVSRD